VQHHLLRLPTILFVCRSLHAKLKLNMKACYLMVMRCNFCIYWQR